MITATLLILLFAIGMLVFVVKLIMLAMRMAWGITKVILYIIGLPLILIGMVVGGLVTLALPLLIVALILAFVIGK